MKTALANQGHQEKKIHCDWGFAFQAEAWKEANLTIVQLDHVFRQGNVRFKDILQDIRKGIVSSEALQFLKQCDRPLPLNSYGIVATVLYAKNKDVGMENAQELAKLPGEEQCFEAEDSVEVYPDVPDQLKAENDLWQNHFFQDCIAEKRLRLKVGAQVMLIKNERATKKKKRLVNGSRGVVVGFAKDDEEEEMGLIVVDSDSDDDLPSGTLYPVVRFLCGTKKVILPERFESRLAGLGVCSREAIPLKLAWAVTIHKSQGLTLDYVKADVSEVFAEAQTYVALSRATDETGLELRGFSEKKVMVNKRALAFYSNPNGTFPSWHEPWDQASEALGNNKDPNKISVVPAAKPGCLQGLAFVFTGEPVCMSRNEVETLVKSCSGLVRSAISGKTNYLVIGKIMDDGRDVTSGQKYAQAKKIISGQNKSNLKIINEQDLFALISKRSRPTQGPVGMKQFFSAR
jgi:hypothetical protein